MRRTIELLTAGLAPGASVLDLGCGPGRYAQQLADSGRMLAAEPLLRRSIPTLMVFREQIILYGEPGVLPAGALGYALAVKNIYTMNVEFYTGVDERREVPLILPPVPDFHLVKQAKVLIVFLGAVMPVILNAYAGVRARF